MTTIVTNKGLAKLAQASVDNPIAISHFAVGDGGGRDIIPDANMESLINEKHRDLINDKYSDGNSVIVECVLRAAAPIEEGFFIRELGIFDEEGDLIVITDVPLQYRPVSGSMAATELQFNITLRVDSEIVELKLTEQTVATADSLKRLQDVVDSHTPYIPTIPAEEVDYVIEAKYGLTGANLANGWYRKYKSG
ncbi:MAG: phage tail protein [Alphaproteobacteria bacterium]|jgi:phage-related tail fiber protein|nr:phage tail protein [Alphaproteobacteria bacterium]